MANTDVLLLKIFAHVGKGHWLYACATKQLRRVYEMTLAGEQGAGASHTTYEAAIASVS